MPAPSVQLTQAVETSVVASVSTGNGAFLSPAVDLIDYEGVVRVVLNTGTIAAGSITVPVLTQSDASGGTYVALATNGAFSASAATVSAVTFNASESLRFIKFSSTVTTGPVLWSVTVVGFKKYR